MISPQQQLSPHGLPPEDSPPRNHDGSESVDWSRRRAWQEEGRLRSNRSSQSSKQASAISLTAEMLADMASESPFFDTRPPIPLTLFDASGMRGLLFDINSRSLGSIRFPQERSPSFLSGWEVFFGHCMFRAFLTRLGSLFLLSFSYLAPAYAITTNDNNETPIIV